MIKLFDCCEIHKYFWQGHCRWKQLRNFSIFINYWIYYFYYHCHHIIFARFCRKDRLPKHFYKKLQIKIEGLIFVRWRLRPYGTLSSSINLPQLFRCKYQLVIYESLRNDLLFASIKFSYLSLGLIVLKYEYIGVRIPMT